MAAIRSVTRTAAEGLSIRWLPVFLIAAVGAVVGVVSWLMEHGSYSSFAGIIVAIGLIAISIPLLRRATSYELDPRTARLLWIALALKFAGGVARYVVAFGVYDGQADAAAYHSVGAELARQFRDGDFVVDLGREVQGTGFIQILTGAVYTVTGATDIGGFLVFSWLGFWGLYLFHRAFVRACPQGDHHRYALLVFLLPSLVFWPSSIGKEAWMCLGLGACAYAAARVLTGASGGIALFGCGLVALGFVRPHVAAIAAVSLFAAYLLRAQPRSSSGLAPIAKLLGIIAIGGILIVAVGELEQFLGVDAFDRESVELTLSEVTQQTGQGGSYTSGRATDLDARQLPTAFVNVTFRPFPWEARNLQALVASIEGVLLAAVALMGARRLLAAVLHLLDTPYLILAATYSVLFVYGFSSFANYGILVRQRVQFLPFLLVLLSLERPLVSRAPASARRNAGPPTRLTSATHGEIPAGFSR